MSKCPHCNGYIDDRPKGDFPTGVPSKEEFEQAHTEPLDYGEGGWLIVSKRLTAEEALAKLQKVLRDDWGGDEEYIPQSVSDLRTYDVGWGTDYDSYKYSEGCYWICTLNNNVTKRWKAWGVSTS